MKKFFVLCCSLFLLGITSMSAKIVGQKDAYRIASKFFSQSPSTRAGQAVSFRWDSNALNPESRSSSAPAFYVFERNGGKGFIIISGEDTTYPILGYSFTESISSVNQLPPNARLWLSKASASILKFREQNTTPTPQVSRMWAAPSRGEVVLQHKTAIWDQGYPYNMCSPMDGSKLSYAGCVATATAIVMKFHQWPQSGTGTTEPYYTESKHIYVGARDLNHPYNWANMPMDPAGSKASREQMMEISTLMSDIGAAFKADYTNEGTGALVQPNVMAENFGYDPGMHTVWRIEYNERNWTQLIQNELRNNGPVLYAGHNPDGGHQFVLDGYTNDSFFHVNWGWSGYYNGYFKISALTPFENEHYNEYQSMELGVKPREKTFNPTNWIQFYRPGIVLSKTDFKVGEQFIIDRLHFWNNYTEAFTGHYLGIHTDREGNFKEYVCPDLYYTIGGNQGIYYSNVPAVINEPIEIGDKIRFLYQEESSEKAELITARGDSAVWEIPIADEYYIHETTSFEFDKTKEQIYVTSKEGVGIYLLDPNRELANQHITPDEHGFIISTKNLMKGKYTLGLMKGDELKEIQLEIKKK